MRRGALIFDVCRTKSLSLAKVQRGRRVGAKFDKAG